MQLVRGLWLLAIACEVYAMYGRRPTYSPTPPLCDVQYSYGVLRYQVLFVLLYPSFAISSIDALTHPVLRNQMPEPAFGQMLHCFALLEVLFKILY